MTWPFQHDCDKFYGNPRNKLWKLLNLTTVKVPFVMTYDNKLVKNISIHKKCAASLSRILQAIYVAAGKDQRVLNGWGVTIFGGSYNFRLMRGGSHLSMHSYGCAIDLDPAKFPMGQSTETFPEPVLKAFADEGWVNLPNDRMHFQAARIG